jgi:hypothetical protein
MKERIELIELIDSQQAFTARLNHGPTHSYFDSGPSPWIGRTRRYQCLPQQPTQSIVHRDIRPGNTLRRGQLGSDPRHSRRLIPGPAIHQWHSEYESRQSTTLQAAAAF